MDRKEAQLLLSALRPGGVEANEPIFAEALALAESDPQLRDWWQAQQKFDRAVSAKLSEIPVPDGLREKIIAAPKIVAFPSQWRHRSLLAAAAVVAFFCVAGAFWRVASSPTVDRYEFTDQALDELGTQGPTLAMTSSDQQKLKDWLQSQNAPIGHVPAKFDALSTVGCQKYFIHGHNVSLMCFKMANGQLAHFFVIEKSALDNPPDPHGMQFDNIRGWNIASWSDDHMAYMVATQSSVDDLKQLL